MAFMITGTDVHDRPELTFTINWIGCSRSNGIGVHDRPERALGARGECDGAPIREDIRSSNTQPSSSDLQDASTKIPNAGEGFK
jgi:hypothetical protein